MFRELLLAFLQRMSPVVIAHGGEIEHLAGDGVMGVFGADRAQATTRCGPSARRSRCSTSSTS